MGTPTEKLHEKIDLHHMEVLTEISRNREYLQRMPEIFLLLKELEGKIDWIQAVPERNEELLTQVNSKIEKIKNQQIAILEHIQKMTGEYKSKLQSPIKNTKPSGFKPLEIPKGNHTLTPFPFDTTSPKSLGNIREMNMLSIFGKKKSAQLLNAEEYEYNEIEERVRNSSIPRFEFREIYKRGNFQMMDSHHFKILEFTTPAKNRRDRSPSSHLRRSG